MTGTVFNIQRYSIHDGPGIRTVVFLKGCRLRCVWCSNPESQLASPEVEFRERLCRRCGLCISACPLGAVNPDLELADNPKIDRQLCDNCGKCADACPHGALRMIGDWVSVGQVVAEATRDADYYRRSGGGVTLSGGEPMDQAEFTRQVLRACHERNIHTAIETSGYADWPLYEEILPLTDLFLYDIKHMDSEAHRQLTGVPNKNILENARRLARGGASIVFRVPLVPDHNLDEGNLRAVAEFAASLHAIEVHLMPFHQLGKEHYRRLGRSYALSELPGLRQTSEGVASIRRACEIMSRAGLQVFVGG